MSCLLRLELELSVQARAFVMARRPAWTAADDDLAASLPNASTCTSIGRTGLLALSPRCR